MTPDFAKVGLRRSFIHLTFEFSFFCPLSFDFYSQLKPNKRIHGTQGKMIYKLSSGAIPYPQEFACTWQEIRTTLPCCLILLQIKTKSYFKSKYAKLHIFISLPDDLGQHSKECILDSLEMEQKQLENANQSLGKLHRKNEKTCH